MTENRPCSGSLPAQAMHYGFSNTIGLIIEQLVLNMEGREEGRSGRQTENEDSKKSWWRWKRGKMKVKKPHVHIQYAVQKSHSTAGQQLGPWRFWQKWFTMVTAGQTTPAPLITPQPSLLPLCQFDWTHNWNVMPQQHTCTRSGSAGLRQRGERTEPADHRQQKHPERVSFTSLQRFRHREKVSHYVCACLSGLIVTGLTLWWTWGPRRRASKRRIVIAAEYRIKWILMRNQLPQGNVVCRLALLTHVSHL